MSDEMTSYVRKDRDNKKSDTGRETPEDVRRRGTLAERKPESWNPPRRRSREEQHADNVSSVAFGRTLAGIGAWAPVFRSDLEEMNRGKVGRPYTFSDSMIYWIMLLISVSNCSVRMASGIAGGLLELVGLKAPSYSRLSERLADLSDTLSGADVAETARRYGDGFLVVRVCSNISARIRDTVIDSTGLNMSSVLSWRLEKWSTGPKDRGWLKLHALADVDSGEIIAYAVTYESVGDAPVLKVLVEAALERGHRIGTLYADGAYGSNDNWIYICREKGLRFVTSFKRNTRAGKNGCEARGEASKLWCSLPYREWKKLTRYGRRWKVEGMFSDFKRMLGECISASTPEGAAARVNGKVEAHNMYKSMRAGIMKVTGNGVIIG